MSIILSIIDIMRLLALYYGTVGFAMYLMSGQNVITLFLISLLSATGCILLQNNKALRYLPLSLLVLLIIPDFSWMRVLAAVPVILLLVLKCYENIWNSTYSNVHSTFNTGLFISTLVILGVMIFFTGTTAKIRGQALPLFIIFTVCSVFQLRMLKNNAEKELGKGYVYLTAGLLGFILIVVLLLSSDTVVSALKAIGSLLYEIVFVPVFMALMYVIMLIPYGIFYLLSLINPAAIRKLDIPGFMEMVQQFLPEIEMSYDIAQLLSVIFKAMVISLFLLLTVYAVRVLTERLSRHENKNAGYVRENITAEKQRKKRSFRLSWGNDSIRDIYRNYLLWCEKRGIPVDGSQASDIICEETEKLTGSKAAKELRDLWLPVRFSEKDSEEDVRTARELLRTIKSSFLKNRRRSEA